MDSIAAMMMGEANRHKEPKVFDWDKAARLIVEHGAKDAGAGLSGDWEWTGDEILADGEPCLDCGTYLASVWATPELEINGERFDCYVMKSETEWTSGTKWPESALEILADGNKP